MWRHPNELRKEFKAFMEGNTLGEHINPDTGYVHYRVENSGIIRTGSFDPATHDLVHGDVQEVNFDG